MLDKEATRRPLERCSLHLESFASKTAFAATLQINTNTLMITFAKYRGRRQRDCGAQHLYGRRKGFSSGFGQGGTPLGLDIALTDARPQSLPQSWSPDAQQVRSVHMGDKGESRGGDPTLLSRATMAPWDKGDHSRILSMTLLLETLIQFSH